ncbi:MAG TPA: FAD-dependent monooxygenase [Vicinamibacterales bacterium]|nr:FAD-dependent monooxygenase [Vicinamibacterales bacterium]
MPTDVLVVGGGPAGAVAAAILARAGARVRLLERERFPRHKLCGDTLNPGALALLATRGLDSAASSGLRVDGMIVSGGGTRVCARYPGGAIGRAIRRRDLDAALLASAVKEGVLLEDPVLVTAPLMTAGRVAGVLVKTPRGERRLDAPLTIAADGRRSRLMFSLGLARHPSWPRRWAIGGYYSGVADLTSFGEMHIRPRGYLGVAPLPDGLTNACLVIESPRDLSDPSRALDDAVRSDPATADRFAGAKRCGPAAVIGPLAVDTTASGSPGLLAAGDAAGFIDPMTGDGLRFALAGAVLAARAAADYLDGSLAEPHRALEIWRRRLFAGKWRFDRGVRRLVSLAPAVRAAAAGARIAPRTIQFAVSYAGDIDAAAPIP